MNKIALVNVGQEFFRQGVFGPITHQFLDLKGIGDLVSLFIRIVFVIAGVIILIFIIMAGMGMIAGAGSNDPEKIEKGKQAATSALIGFVVVFTAYWIVQLIELWTGIKIL